MQRKLDQQGAESVAIQALTYLAQDSERLGRFLHLVDRVYVAWRI